MKNYRFNCPYCITENELCELKIKCYPYPINNEFYLRKNLKCLMYNVDDCKLNKELKIKRLVHLFNLIATKYGRLIINKNNRFSNVVKERLNEFYYKDGIRDFYKIYRDIFGKRI